MNKIFKVIWNVAAQAWVAVSELSKVKAISSSSSAKEPSSSKANIIKTIAITLPIASMPFVANAYVEIGGEHNTDIKFDNGYVISGETSAIANPTSGERTWAYDYQNPGNKSYYDANSQGNLPTGYSNAYEYAYGIAIGNKANALNSTGASNGIAIGDYAQAVGGLATSIGAFSNAEDLGATAIGTSSRAKGFNSLAIMRQSAAIGEYSAAIGSVAYAQGNASFAFGASATSNGNQSIAIGNTLPKTIDAPEAGEARKTKYDGLNNTQSNGDRSVAIGSGAKTNGNDSFAFGSLAQTGKFDITHDDYLNEDVNTPKADASAERAIAFGTSAAAEGNASVAFGYGSKGSETNSIAFGVESQALKNDAIAFGSKANASEANSIAFGSNAQALHENVITIGKDSKATKKGSMSIGESAQSNANNSLALGNSTIINQEDIKNANAKYTNDTFDIEYGVVAIANKGTERRLVNLAAGREDTDAVNVKQLTEVNDNLARTIAGPDYNGYSIDDNGKYTYKAPDFNIKNQVLHTVKDAVELAQTNYVSVNADVNKQKDADSNYDNLGAKGSGSIALGKFTGTNAAAVDSIAIGHNTKVNAANTVAIGANITASTSGSVILGDSSKSEGSHKTETVTKATVNEHTYEGFAGAVENEGKFVSVGEKGKERQIKNVAAGHIEKDSTDAINGSQLYAVASRVETGLNELVTKGLNFQPQSGKAIHKDLGDTLNIVGKGNKADTEYEAANIKTFEENGSIVVALAKDLSVDKVTAGKAGKDGVDGEVGVKGKDGSAVTMNGKDGSIGLNGKDGKNAISIKSQEGKVGVDGNDGNTRLVYVEKDNPNKTHEIATTDDGLKFTGNNEVVNSHKLNSKVAVKGEGVSKEKSKNFKSAKGNINVKADGKNTLEVQLAKDVDLTKEGSLTVGGTTVNNKGVSVENGPSITQDGIDAGNKRITNVAPGKKGTDAVNVDQLNEKVGNIRNDMNKMNKNLRAGIAGAMASGGLYHATLPGKSMVAAGVGTYKGESAVAVGYSRLSDNGKVGVKFSVNTNTRGDTGAAASMGYQW